MAIGTVRISGVDTSSFDWTVLVQVIEADRVKVARDGDLTRSFRRFEFGDFQGIKVSVVVFDDDIAIVDGSLLPFREYYISNAEVREIPELVGTGLYSFYWVIKEGTVIEEVAGSGELALPFYFGLRSFQYFHFVADTDICINVIGVVIHAFPARDVYFEGSKRYGRDYIIVDQCKRPVVLTLWDDYEVIEGRVIDELMASMPIIIAMRLRVTTHNYLSLSTQPSSVIIVAPDVLEAKHLDDWCNANISELVRMVFDDMAYLDPCILLPPVREATLTPIYNVISQAKSVSFRDQMTFWIKGRVEIAWPSTRFWHMARPHCHELYEFSSTLGIICLSCGQGMHEFPRAWVRLTVLDSTGYVNVIALGPEAENLIGLSVTNMYRVSDQQTFEISKRVSRRIDGKELLCYLKHSSKMIRTTTITDFTIVACDPVSGSASSQQMPFGDSI